MGFSETISGTANGISSQVLVACQTCFIPQAGQTEFSKNSRAVIGAILSEITPA
jgi:hypothetical protein